MGVVRAKGYPGGIRPWAWVAACLLAVGMVYADFDPSLVSIGIDGYAKFGRWYPVSIGPVPSAERIFVIPVTSRHHRTLSRHGRFEAERDPSTGEWRALVHSARGSEDGLHFEWVAADGVTRTIETPLALVDSNALLVWVATDRPEEFSFMGSIESAEWRITRAAVGGSGMIRGHSWKALQSLDVVVLDGAVPEGDADRQALREWVAMGGTAILTDRALSADASWGWIDGGAESREYAFADAAELTGLLDGLADDVVAAGYIPAPGEFHPWIMGREGAIVGARTVGRGRVIVCTLDWRSMEMQERALYEAARRAIWTRLLGFHGERQVTHFPGEWAIPPEAQMRSLLWPVLFFLLFCSLLLGPVNWLIAIRRGRREYAVVTLPAGAAILAVLAIVVGHHWRTRDVVVTDRTISISEGGASWSMGVSGILSPLTHRYGVATNPNRLLQEISLGHFSRQDDQTGQVPVQSGAGTRIENIAISRWAMGFFRTMQPAEPGANFRAWGRAVSLDSIEGEVENATTSTITGALVFLGSHFTVLGDLPPHSVTPFTLLLEQDREKRFGRCPGCGNYHIERDFFEEIDLPPTTLDLMRSIRHMAGRSSHLPTVIGFDSPAPPVLKVDNLPRALRRDVLHLLAAPLEMRWSSPVVVPPALAYALRPPLLAAEDRRYEEQWTRIWPRVPLAFMPHALALRTALAAQPALREPESPPGVRERGPATTAPSFYALPAVEPSSDVWVTLTIHPPEPGDPPPVEFAIEAFDWENGAWVELGRAEVGEYRMSAGSGSSAFMLRTQPVIALRAVAPPGLSHEERFQFARSSRVLEVTVDTGEDGDER